MSQPSRDQSVAPAGNMPLRDRARTVDRWLVSRLDTVVPMLMERQGIDAWVLIAREYNEDPVLMTMLPATWMGARRRTILLFTERGHRRHAVTRYDVGDAFPSAWDPSTEPDQWTAVARLLEQTNPARIAIDVSPTFPLADGLSHTDHELLIDAIGSMADRLVPAGALAVGWLETRTAPEITAFTDACVTAHGVLRRGLSDEVITPGVTTTADVAWWLREQVVAMRLDSWFHPGVSVQRAGRGPGSPTAGSEDIVIVHGDLVHIDFGLAHLGLHTDQQQHGYVLLPGETTAPEGISEGLRTANRLQDLLMAEFATGRTGNQILAAARKAAANNGIDATIYTHPIGVHGHAAGPTIGLWDRQGGVPGQGDHPVHPDTAYSIELAASVPVHEWGGQTVRFMLEEDAYFDGATVRFVDGRQTAPWLIPS